MPNGAASDAKRAGSSKIGSTETLKVLKTFRVFKRQETYVFFAGCDDVVLREARVGRCAFVTP